jgi:transposase InsO family protein
MEVPCVIDTINKAKARRNTDLPLILHSDRGSQYVSNEYIKATAKMQRSYSKKAFPWDNACIEYIEAFYNTKRIHSHCDYMLPDDFEKLYAKVQNGSLLLAG